MRAAACVPTEKKANLIRVISKRVVLSAQENEKKMAKLKPASSRSVLHLNLTRMHFYHNDFEIPHWSAAEMSETEKHTGAVSFTYSESGNNRSKM